MRPRPTRALRAGIVAGTVAALAAASLLVTGPGTAQADPSTAAPTAPANTPQRPLTIEQALTQAHSSGQAVAVDGATTSTDSITANPDGSLTRTVAASPVRKRTGGSWTNLNPTLVANADGSISTADTTSDLHLSSGGNGPLATMTTGGRSLALTLPMTLPAPTLSGPTATYSSVLPGVDLIVSADAQGGFTESLIVHSATAATNPALATIALSTATTGVSVSADSTGNLTAADSAGHAVFSAPAPIMWDSATTGTIGSTRKPAASSADGPGDTAHTAAVGVTTSSGTIDLKPDQALLTATSTVYPVYIDPGWFPSGAKLSGWSTITPTYPDTRYWNTTPEPNGHMQVGNAGSILSRTLINFPIDISTLSGATINDATLDITEDWSYSCDPRVVNVYAPGPTLSYSNAIWDSWFNPNDPNRNVNLGSAIASANVAYGYNSTCPAHGVGFNILNTINADVAAKKTLQTFAFVAGDESDLYAWKKFDEKTPTMTIHYDHVPSAPTGLTTSPKTSCTAAAPTIVGEGDVTLYAPVYDRDGSVLNVGYSLWKTSDGSVVVPEKTGITAASGTTAVLDVPQATLDGAAGNAVTEFSWHVHVADGLATSSWSITCNFSFDHTRPGRPTVTEPDSSTVGQPATFTVAPPSTGTVPTSYMYQLNAGPPGIVTPDDPANPGHASITITPTRFTNILSVSPLSAGGNAGVPDTKIFNSTSAPNAVDTDLTGDGNADLLTPGDTNGLPAGLWLASGRNNGQLATGATNVGIYGNGADPSNAGPNNFDGAQVITGRFTDNGMQDALVYYKGGNVPGSGMVLSGNGDGTPFQTQYIQNSYAIFSMADDYGNNPIQLANAGTASGQGLNYPDLIAVSGSSCTQDCGDVCGAAGYYLTFYVNADATRIYQGGTPLTTKTPDGDCGWNGWTIDTAQVATGTSSKTDMFLWNKGSGELWLWANLSFDSDTGALSYTPYELSSHWTGDSNANLVAADINGDGTPDLWTVGSGATVTPWVVSLTGTPSISALTAQALSTETHTWKLDDATTDGTLVGSATDIVGGLNATGNGATGHTGDTFDPDVMLQSANAADLATSTAAVDTSKDFTVAAWVNLTTTGGTVLSQDGAHTAGFRISANPADNSWLFALSRSDVNSPTWDVAEAHAGSVRPGVWTHLTATYRKASGVAHLYVDGVDTASVTHTTTWSAPNGFQMGDYLGAGTHTDYLNGQLALVQTWNQVVSPTQATTPASYYQPVPQTRILDTRTGLGSPTGPVAANAITNLQITTKAGVPASNVTAVALTLTVTAPTAAGHLDVYPDDTPPVGTSNVNFNAAQTISNYVIVPVGPNGHIDLANTSPGTVQLLGDITGYFTSDNTASGDTSYTPLTPTRLMDTRDGTGGTHGPLPAGSTTPLTVAGTAGIPTSVTAVAVNITATNETASSYLITYADGTTKPAISGLQFTAGQDISGLTIVPVGTNGKIDLWNGGTTGSSTNLIVDAVGYLTPGTTGQKYHALPATRMIDTRQTGGPVTNRATLPVAQGNTVVAANPTLVLNMTATAPTANGYLVTYPDGTTMPATSNVNYVTNQTIPNLDLASVGDSGTLDITNQSSGTVQIIVDCLGYFADN
jgi:hypothetical protein